jgi:hypothetical protein
MKQTKQTQLRFVWLSVLWMLAFVLSGCGASSYEVIASASYLPSSAQVERDRIILAIPNDLRARLEAAVQESNASAQLGANRQFLAQMPNPRYLMQKKLLEVVLDWAGQKPPDERVAEQTERLQQPTNELKLDDPRIQYGAGVVAGAAIGTVPLGPYMADVGIELHALPKGTYYARVGKCAGELISGVIQMAVGCSGMTAGVAATGTGGGAPAGVVIISGSFALTANGYATSVHALDEAQRLWKEGPPPDAPASSPPEKLLKPKTRPKQPAPAPQATQAQPAKPATTAQPQAGADVKPKAKDAPTTVYRSVNQATGEVQYVGITNEFARRQAEHLRSRNIRIESVLEGLSRSDALAVEQALIEMHGLGKNGGTLLNKINAIAKTNPTHAAQLKRGYELIEAAKAK